MQQDAPPSSEREAPAPEATAGTPGQAVALHRLRASDREEWEALFRSYMSFYNRESEQQAMYDTCFAGLLRDTALHAFVARAEDHGGGPECSGELLGLVHFLVHPNTSGPDRCYLQDLFTLESCRGRGVGRKLIDAVVGWCRERGDTGRVYWSTAQDNTQARALYDKVATESGYVQYRINIE